MNLGQSGFVKLGSILLICSWLAGCATVPTTAVSKPKGAEVDAKLKGVYHKVNKGETLWRIAKTYKVSVEEVIQANRIPNAASIDENQLLFIPGADVVKEVIQTQAPESKDIDYSWPLKGKIISYFEDRKGAFINHGLDIKAVDGDEVKAANEGRVVFVDHLAGYGVTVILEHRDGFFTVYGHNDRAAVKLGDFVFRGAAIAQLASNGRDAYLHFELRKGNVPKNPLHYLPREM